MCVFAHEHDINRVLVSHPHPYVGPVPDPHALLCVEKGMGNKLVELQAAK